MGFSEFVREDFKASKIAGLFWWMDGAFRNRPSFLGIKAHSAKGVGYHRSLDWLRRMTRPPANDVTPQTALGENIPKRLALARSAGVRPCPAVHRVGLDKTMDSMFVVELSCRDGVPEHRREDWLQSSQITHYSAVDEGVEGRHQTFLDQRGNVFPIGRVPSDQENSSLVAFVSHRKRIR